jgi:glucose-6-phosphate 1-dehydrogenase
MPSAQKVRSNIPCAEKWLLAAVTLMRQNPRASVRNANKRTYKVSKISADEGPQQPQVVVLVGATGDLARRKLWPGLFRLVSAGFIPGCRIIGVSLEDLDDVRLRTLVHAALEEFSTYEVNAADWEAFANNLGYVPLAAGAAALKAAVDKAEQAFGGESRRLHYLSVPPNAALSAVRLLADAGLVERSRIIMEKPFGTDLRAP